MATPATHTSNVAAIEAALTSSMGRTIGTTISVKW